MCIPPPLTVSSVVFHPHASKSSRVSPACSASAFLDSHGFDSNKWRTVSRRHRRAGLSSREREADGDGVEDRAL